MLDDCYRDLNYALDEDTFAETEEQDVLQKRFVRAWEGLLDGYRVRCIFIHIEGEYSLMGRVG